MAKKVEKKKTTKAKKEPAAKINDIGLGTVPPKSACQDVNCPYHGKLPIRGQIMEGIVVSDRMDKSAVVKREYTRFIPKYERYQKRTSRYLVHNPPCIDAKVGTTVKIVGCRPLSKNKSYVIVEVGGRE